ncbi:MAG: metal-dependent hydrolase [Planctomycetaceae bacterium]|nr:metal-dependent hydrolase [Planctomycetaceae bacterium]
MAGYREHISVSGMLGIAYAFAAVFLFGYSAVQAGIAAILTWIAGMLPDLDSETGRPIRELVGVTASVAPLFVLQNVHAIGVSGDRALLFALVAYGTVRYGGAFLLGKLTVHRGMFHSIPALLIAAELAFLGYRNDEVRVRMLMGVGVGIGFLSHLVLDELYSVRWDGGRIRLAKSAGSALKFFGPAALPNGLAVGLLIFLTYATLVSGGYVPQPGMQPAPESLHADSALEDAPLYRIAEEPRDTELR